MFTKNLSLLAAVLVLGMSSAALASPTTAPSLEARMMPNPNANSGTDLQFESTKSAPLDSVQGYIQNDLTGEVSGLPSGSSNSATLRWDQAQLGGSYLAVTGDQNVRAGGGWTVGPANATGDMGLTVGSQDIHLTGRLDGSGDGSISISSNTDMACKPSDSGNWWWTCTRVGAAAAAPSA